MGEGEVEVRRVEEKIRVRKGPPPPRGLRRQLELLRAAAEDEAEVRALLHRLLADYTAVVQETVC